MNWFDGIFAEKQPFYSLLSLEKISREIILRFDFTEFLRKKCATIHILFLVLLILQKVSNQLHLILIFQEAGALRYYTLPNLKPGTSYVVCFETIHTSNDDDEESSVSNSPKNSEDCHETRTLNSKSEMVSALHFPYTEVLISIVVSASVSACLAVMCCYLMPKLHKRGSNGTKNQVQSNNDHLVEVNLKDENDNNKSAHHHHHLKNHDVENSLGEPVELIKR